MVGFGVCGLVVPCMWQCIMSTWAGRDPHEASLTFLDGVRHKIFGKVAL